MRCAFFAAVVLSISCSNMLPTAPTNAHMTLAISQASLPVGGTAIVTATIREANGAPVNGASVSFSSSLGTFAPADAFTASGVAVSTFTATRTGMGAVGALSGAVSAEPLQVRIGEFPSLPEINTTPPTPTVFVSCNTSAPAGVPLVCAVSSGQTVQNVVINWGDGSPEQSIGLTSTAAHVFARAGSYAVSVRGVDGSGQLATATATATVVEPPPPPPLVAPPVVTTTSVFLSQEADLVSGCAAFNVSATPQTGLTITLIEVGHSAGTQGPWTITSGARARFATCGLIRADILTATATDSSGVKATYQLIVK